MRDAFSQALGNLREMITVADETIRGLKLGVSGHIDMSGNRRLMYDHRQPGEKRSLYVQSDEGEDIDIERLGIESKQEVAGHIPMLVDYLTAHRAERAVSIQESADRLGQFLERLL